MYNYKLVISFVTQNPFVSNTHMNSNMLTRAPIPAVTEPPNLYELKYEKYLSEQLDPHT
jgi:hypothetical protein